MSRSRLPISANDAAWQVVGTKSDRTIEAMKVSGTTWNGEVELRITGQIGGDPAVARCFDYKFTHTSDSAQPEPTHCPDGQPVTLRPPTPEPDLISPTARARLYALLASFSVRQRQDPDSMTAVLKRLYPLPTTVAADTIPTGEVEFVLNDQTQCVTAYLPPVGPPQLYPGQGVSCQGG